MFSPLFGCEHDLSIRYGWIWTKLGGQVGCFTRTNLFDFVEDPNQDPDTRIFKSDYSLLSD